MQRARARASEVNVRARRPAARRILPHAQAARAKRGGGGGGGSEDGERLSKREAAQAGRKRALDKVLAEIEGAYGKGSIMVMDEAAAAAQVKTVSTGALNLDLALGGGLPRGRICELYGPESSGKTTLALSCMASAQRQGLTAAFIDAEHAFDPMWAETCGLDMSDMVVCQPESGEMALEVVDQLARSAAVDLIVVDSVAALTPRSEIEGEIGLFQVGAHARLMSQALRKIASNAYKADCTIVFLNQLRQKVGVIYGSPEVTTGGNALKFYSSVRMDIRRTEVIRGENAGTGAARDATSPGIRVRVKMVKNKVAFPYRIAELDILFGKGIDSVGAVLQAAVENKVVERRGAWYTYGGQNNNMSWQGKVRICTPKPCGNGCLPSCASLARAGHDRARFLCCNSTLCAILQ